jgi:4-hydroxy-2-oxoheptanedioate aldolase
MKGREIRERLHGGQFVYSSALIAPSSRWPGAVKASGIDFVFIDTEHIPLTRETVSWMCTAYAGVGIPPVVRIPCPDAFEASKVLDGGAHGIIAPYVESADQVRELVGVCRYRPLKGARLQAALENPGSLEPELRKYLDERNADTLLILNIESTPAIENLDRILSVPGVDSVLIGPHDLSCSLGIPEQYTHPKFDEAVRTIFRIARKHNVGAGIHFWTGLDQEVAWAKAGGNLVMHSSDLALFSQQLKKELTELRSALGDTGRDRKGSGDDTV